MWAELASTRELKSVIDVLSAMITPAVLILASGSLIMTTSSRLIRVIDRIREMVAALESLDESPADHREARREHLFAHLKTNTVRARLLQRAMALLYVGISFFIATSVAIGVVSLLHVDVGWIPMLTGFFGAGLLFTASLYLIYESRLALATTYAEMDYIRKNYMQDR